MTYLKLIAAAIASFFLCISYAQAERYLLDKNQIHSGESATIKYDFKDYEQIICTSADSALNTTSEIFWTYKGQAKNATLPMTLKQKNRFSGDYADPQGELTIKNNSPEILTVTCEVK